MRAAAVLLAAASALLLPGGALAARPAPAGHAVHERREEHPREWRRLDRAHPQQVLPFKIALKEQNTDGIEAYLMDVSDPASPNFGKHWTAERVANTFLPSQETHDSVMAWLERTGIEASRVTKSTGHNWLHFDATVAEAEEMLATEYHVYEHDVSRGKVAACERYHLPHGVREHIDFIMPTVDFDAGFKQHHGQPSPAAADADADLLQRRGELDLEHLRSRLPSVKAVADAPGLTGTKNCSNLITIDCLRALYKFPFVGNVSASNAMGIAEWSDYLYPPDLEIFLKNYTRPLVTPATTFPEFISIDGGRHANLSVAKQGFVIESALDFQTAYSIIWPQKLRLYQNGDSVNVDSVGTFNIFLDALDASYCTYRGGNSPYYDPKYPDPMKGGYKGPLQCGGAPLSNAISFSYGQTESQLSRFYQQRQCNEWAKLGMQGVSVLFASGDSGVGTRFNAGFPNTCLNKDNNTLSVNGTRFAPGFPVNCPYVTAVGGTDLLTKDIDGGEKAVFFSGGGFSNVFPRPAYQAKAVANYLATYSPKYGPDRFNHSDVRAYPDVSALGLNLATVYLGQTLGVGGTSASAPIFASVVTLLNEARIKAGKGPVGFLNPLLYANPGAFNDVTVGSNPGCNTTGFHAQKGWDPVSGLGSPNYPKMLKVFLNAP